MKHSNSVERFSDRVGNYVRFRPSYPPALLQALASDAGLGPGCAVADVGSGTGIFTRLLLEAGARVHAVEPNSAMRGAAEAEFRGNPAFASVTGTGEATGLPPRSVSLITCAQAFHWFDPPAARREFIRILRPGGWCALIWNTSVRDGSAFAEGYEDIKNTYGTDFKAIRHESITKEQFTAFFGHDGWVRKLFPNGQSLDYPSLEGRLMSSSYAPKADDPRHLPMLAALRRLFDRCQVGGLVRMDYQTELNLGQFAGPP